MDRINRPRKSIAHPIRDYQAIIFDCDGTLTDSMPVHYVAWHRTLTRYGLAFPEDRFYSLGGMPTDKIIRLLSVEQNIPVDPTTVSVEKEEAFVELIGLLKPIEPVVEVAQYYRGTLPMAVASGGFREIILQQLRQIQCDDWFDTIVTAEDTQRHKPFPDVFLKAAEQLRVPPEKCLVYEDSDLGIEAAKAAKMDFIDVRSFLPLYESQLHRESSNPFDPFIAHRKSALVVCRDPSNARSAVRDDCSIVKTRGFHQEDPQSDSHRKKRCVQRNRWVELTADLYRPASDDTLPIVMMIHGGGWISGDKWNVASHAFEMAEAGYVVMAINYRLSPKFKWPAHLEDCRSAVAWIVDHAEEWKADVKRIGAWGYSAGGHLSLLLALDPGPKQPRIQAVVAGGAPCDLSFLPEDSDVLTPFIGGKRSEFPAVYRLASPIAHLDKKSPPIFLFHGSEDLLVPLANSRDFYLQATNLGVMCEHHEVEKLGHLMTFVDSPSRKLAIEFFEKHLKANLAARDQTVRKQE